MCSISRHLPLARVEDVLDSLGNGRIFSLSELVSSFHQSTVHEGIVLFTVVSPPKQHSGWLVMPQGSSPAPR